MNAAMAATLTPELATTAALVFALGVKHGLDPDHLVAIDGLTRSSGAGRPRRWNGVFFSLGHGLVVTLIGVALALAALDWQPPAWLEHAGAWISIGVLLVLGGANLAAALRAGDGGARLAGPRGRWLASWLSAGSHPLLVACIGAAFAISFDTLSHALVFSAAGAASAGWMLALALGLVFTLGMALTDALNGWWVARLLASADRRAARASRLMSLAIAALCLLIAAAGIAGYVVPVVGEFVEVAAPVLGVATLAALAAVYVAARRATIAFRI